MKSKYFTLIELLVVIGIISILSSMLLVALGSARNKAKAARVKSDFVQFRTAIEMYYGSNNTYPCPTYNNFTTDVPDSTTCLNTALASYFKLPLTDPWDTPYVWHFHPGTSECISIVSKGVDKTYSGFYPLPYHCQVNKDGSGVNNGGDDLILVIS